MPSWWDRFGQIWANQGLTDDPTTAQANAGWAFIGQAPPTVEQFNSMFQWSDDKDNWLYGQIANCILGSGQTPSSADLTQLYNAIKAMMNSLGIRLAHGECRLVYTSATAVTLQPRNGCALIINGVQQQIPAAGIIGSNAGLSANTTYHVYAHMVSGSMALAFSATGHTTDTSAANNGIEIMSGDPTYTLVGKVRTNASSQFQHDGLTFNGVLSWFHRRRVTASYSNNSTVTFSQTVTGVVPTYSIGFLSWGDEAVDIGACGNVQSSIANTMAWLAVNIDSTTSAGAEFGSQCIGTSLVYGYAATDAFSNTAVAEGWHTGYMLGACSGGSALISVLGAQCRLYVTTNG